MKASMIPGFDLLGEIPSAAVISLALIWTIFHFMGIRVNRRSMRFLGIFFTGVTLSLVLGIYAPQSLMHYHFSQAGGVLGEWVQRNCEVVGLAKLSAVLATLAFGASLLLATDWLFIDYLTAALGLKTTTALATGGSGIPDTPLAGRESQAKPPARPISNRIEDSRPLKSLLHVDEPKQAPLSVSAARPMQARPKEPAIREGDRTMAQTEPHAAPEKQTGSDEETSTLLTKSEPAEISTEQVPAQDTVPGANIESSQEPAAEMETDSMEQESAEAEQAEELLTQEPSETTMMSVEDRLLLDAASLVIDQREASISLLRRELGLGFSKAAQLVDRLEKAGVIGPPDAEGRRAVQSELGDLDRLLNVEPHDSP